MPTDAAPSGETAVQPAAPLDEQAVLAGLKKRKLDERGRFILASPATRSEAVFDALAALYPINNVLKASVLLAMRQINERRDMALTAKFTRAVREELERRLAATDETRHFLWMLAEIHYWQDRPQAAADEFVRWVADNVQRFAACDTIVAAETADAACVYFALRGEERALADLRERVGKSRTLALRSARQHLLALFTRQRDPALVDYGCELLRAADVRFPESWVSFATGFGDYARALGRELPADVAQKITAIIEAEARLAEGTLEAPPEEDDHGPR